MIFSDTKKVDKCYTIKENRYKTSSILYFEDAQTAPGAKDRLLSHDCVVLELATVELCVSGRGNRHLP